MKTYLHKADSRGDADHGWLKSKHTFSFANYYDANRMGFGALRVINDDTVAPSMGFGTHPHRDMEIISVPLKGSLRHKDTMGNDFVISKGEVQAMSAGKGIAHSEYNNCASDDVNFLQIWVMPKKLGIEPNYSQKEFSDTDREGKFQLVVSPDGRNNSVEINQDAYFSLVKLEKGKSLDYKKYQNDNGVYILNLSGQVKVFDDELESRDGLGVEGQDNIKLAATDHTELLIMEVPMKGVS